MMRLCWAYFIVLPLLSWWGSQHSTINIIQQQHSCIKIKDSRREFRILKTSRILLLLLGCLNVWTNKSARCSYKSMIDVWWYQTPCVGDDNNPRCWATLGDQVSNIDNQSNINCTRISQEYVLCVQGRSYKLQYANRLQAIKEILLFREVVYVEL